jgi:hypothetical protein
MRNASYRRKSEDANASKPNDNNSYQRILSASKKTDKQQQALMS